MAKYHIVFSPKAKTDLKEIYQYTLSAWGQKQATVYLDKIEEAVLKLLKFPKSGVERNDIKAGYRSLIVEKHIIFYELHEKSINIYGVLHERVDVNRPDLF
jgi:toxin ParE1/3/4